MRTNMFFVVLCLTTLLVLQGCIGDETASSDINELVVKSNKYKVVVIVDKEKELEVAYKTLAQLSKENNNEPLSPRLASEFGLIPMDKAFKDENARLLREAINTYGHIIIDATYYIGDITEKASHENIVIEGINDGTLIFDISEYSVFIDVNSITTLKIENVSFLNTSSDNPLHIVANQDNRSKHLVDSVKIQKCNFNGNLSVYRQLGDKSLNPENIQYGIKEFIFKGNLVKNTQLTFISLSDTPFDYVEISDNKVKNFSFTFAYMGVTNGIEFGREVIDSRDMVKIYNNVVINEDHWWAIEGQTYHTFVLTETDEVIYDSNYVEGLKADFDLAIYDAYLSSNKVTYTNNTWKNNICFNIEKKFNTLIKAKTGVDAVRLYDNNTYIVEEEFAEKLGKSKEELFVYFIDINSEMEHFEITNNTFDIYDLRFQVSSRVIKELIFNHNTINADFASGRMFIIRVSDSYESSVVIEDNYIDIKQTELQAFGDEPENTKFGILQMIMDSQSDGVPGFTSITMNDNIIIGPIYHVFYSVLSSKYSGMNNRLTVVKDLFDGLTYLSYIPAEFEMSVEFK